MTSQTAEQIRAARKPNWLTVCGERAPELEARLLERVEGRIASGEYSWHDAAYISKMHLQASGGRLQVTDKTLEKLRRLCQLWDVEIRTKEISSHRKFVGPVIVAAKRALYPVLRIFLKDFIRQQRSFNAQVISLLTDLANDKQVRSDKDTATSD